MTETDAYGVGYYSSKSIQNLEHIGTSLDVGGDSRAISKKTKISENKIGSKISFLFLGVGMES